MSKIALVGLGLVGRAWAISFARAGHEVAIWDDRPEATDEALTFVNKFLPDLDANELLHGEAALYVRARMRRAVSLEDALEGASYVQENTPEDVETKRRVFAELDRLADPEAVLASSTSAILPSRFTETLERPRALPRRPSDQSALSDPRRRDRPGAVDGREASSSAPPPCSLRPDMRRS